MQKSREEIHKARPISPHLSIYKPQISSVLSIGHRLSGVGLFFMISALGWWFILWVFSKFDPIYLKIFDSSFVSFLLIVTSYGFFYHLCTGIRHLIWDTGWGFSIRAINYSGWLAVIASILLTLIFWMFV
jgi:succinate dehydrogenase / fumarate reductase, cytochrome b subunit